MWGLSGDGDDAVALDLAFNADTLQELRRAVLAMATAAGLPDARSSEGVLAVHELAANAVLHGGGAGRAVLRLVAGELHCKVSDPGTGTTDGDARTDGTVAGQPWPLRPGHGLWLARKVADRVTMAPGASGSHVTAVFALSGFGGSAADQ
jgi:anti-sigma regulatory factor (Ser/Thr protein kinase)